MPLRKSMPIGQWYRQLGRLARVGVWAAVATFVGLVFALISYVFPRATIIDPVVEISFDIKHAENTVDVVLKNEGSTSINNIRIRNVARIIGKNGGISTSYSPYSDWNTQDYLAPGGSVKFAISSDDNEYAFQKASYSQSENPTLTMTFVTKFRREPDKKIIKQINTLFFLLDKEGRPVPYDPSKHYSADFVRIEKKVEELENDFDY